MAARLEPLQDEAKILSQSLTDRKEELTYFIKEIKAKLEEPFSPQIIVEVQE